MNPSTLYIIFFSVLAVGILANLFQRKINYLNKYIIPFGISFVLSLIFLQILPELYQTNNKLIGLFFVIGFALQILLELLSKGIEHGHIHAPKSHVGVKLIIPLMLGLCLHSFIEGMPLISIENTTHLHGGHQHHSNEISGIYFMMIIVHKLPIAAILMFFFIKHINQSWKRYLLLLIFALTAPLGAILGFTLSNSSYFNEFSMLLLALSTGMLLHIATLLVFEKYHDQKEKWANIALIIGGLILGVIFYY